MNINNIDNYINIRKNNSVYTESSVYTEMNINSCYKSILENKTVNITIVDRVISNWRKLDCIEEVGFDKVLDIMEEVCCKSNNVHDIDRILSLIKENVIKQSKQKITTFKSNLTRRSPKSNISDNFKKNVDTLRSNKEKNLNKLNKKKVQESYDSLLEYIEISEQYNRVYNNYNKLNNSFNIEEILDSDILTNDLEAAVNEIANIINENYKSVANKAKLIIALETCLYSSYLNKVSLDIESLVEHCNIYFLNNSDISIKDINSVIESSILLGKEYIILVENEELEYNNNYGLLYEAKSKTNKDKKKKVKQEIIKIKLDKLKPSEGVKKAFRKMYAESPEQIIENLPNLLSWVRVSLVITLSFAINPVLGIVSFIADHIISNRIRKDECLKAIKAYRADRDKAKKRLIKMKDGPAKKRLEEYIEKLEKEIEKLEEYYNQIKHDADEDVYEFDDDGGDDIDFDFDFSFDESSLYVVDNLSYISENVDNIMGIYNNNKIVDKIDISNLKGDSLLEFTNISKDLFNNNIINSIISLLEVDLAEAKGIVYSDIRLAINKLKDSNNSILESIDSNDNCVTIAEKYNLIIELNNYLHKLLDNTELLNEKGDFTSSMNLALIKLNKTGKKVKDMDKTVSKNIDVTANTFINAAKRSVSNDNREAIIRGSLIPSASKLLKIALTTSAVGVFNPVLAAIGIMGWLGVSKQLQVKDKQLLIDEIEIELDMVDRYLRKAENEDDLIAQKELLTTKRSLERQRQRIKYKLAVQHNVKYKPTPSSD